MSGDYEGKKYLNRNKKRLLFYICLIAIPSIQYFVFYFLVNIESILLSFQKYEYRLDALGYTISFALFENFSEAWKIFASSTDMIRNSLVLFLCNFILVSTLSLFFSYYIAKKHFMHGFFRIMLFLPNIISSIALVTIYQTIVNDVFVALCKELGLENWLVRNNLDNGLLGNNAPENVMFITVLFYNLWVGFGTNVMLYTGAMSSIDPSIVESAQLDGVSFLGEFIYIYVPMIWPTFTTFVVTGLTGLFTSTMGLLIFYGTAKQPPFQVFGYFLYIQSLRGDVVASNYSSYSVLSALGIIITAIIVPITLLVRKMMEKYGPSTD